MSCCIIYTCSILQKDLCIPSLNFFPFPIAFFVPFVSSFSLTLPYLYYHPFPYSFFFPSLFSIFVTRLSGNFLFFVPFQIFFISPLMGGRDMINTTFLICRQNLLSYVQYYQLVQYCIPSATASMVNHILPKNVCLKLKNLWYGFTLYTELHPTKFDFYVLNRNKILCTNIVYTAKY